MTLAIRRMRSSRSTLRNARYCEIFTIFLSPSPVAQVNNSSGSTTALRRWEALDPAALARDAVTWRSSANGPRHFLMDSATANVGGRHRFGALQMTAVATLPIRSTADLVQASYRDRTVNRRNTWTWKRGRTVFELIAPGGRRYVMQSYAQIVDPSLTLRQLPRLGHRLALPPGWSYRWRVLGHRLTVVGPRAARRSSRTTSRTPTSGSTR